MKTNEAGLNIIKSSEGCRLTAYADAGGIPTIGYGHTGADVVLGDTITQDRADTLLISDISRFEKGVGALVSITTPLTSNQFSALVSFAFNVGLNTLKHSTLLRKLNEGDYEGAANEFPKWIHANGQILPGLATRRAAEQALFLQP